MAYNIIWGYACIYIVLYHGKTWADGLWLNWQNIKVRKANTDGYFRQLIEDVCLCLSLILCIAVSFSVYPPFPFHYPFSFSLFLVSNIDISVLQSVYHFLRPLPLFEIDMYSAYSIL